MSLFGPLLGRRDKNSPGPLIPPVVALAHYPGALPTAAAPSPVSAPPVGLVRRRPWYRAPERKSISVRPFRDFRRLFLRCHFGMFLLALLLAYVLCQGNSPLMLVGLAAFPVMLVLHIVSTFWLLLWWPFRGTLLWYGVGGLLFAYYALLFLVDSHRPSVDQLAPFLVLHGLWLFVGLTTTAFLRFHRTYLDRFVETPEEKAHADIDQACQWAVKYVRERYTPHAQAIETYYTEADLERDLHGLLHDSFHRSDATFVHDRAKQLEAKIERFRAYETVRQACLHEAQRIGNVPAWQQVRKQAAVLLNECNSLSHTRKLEASLLNRIRQIAELHTSHHQQPAAPVNPHAHIEAAIAASVRDRARPSDSEDDILREIEFQVRGYRQRVAA